MIILSFLQLNPVSPPAREAWIEIFVTINAEQILSRSPPAREAWIEIAVYVTDNPRRLSRLPQGRRGLKFRISVITHKDISRLPQGRRGLKYLLQRDGISADRSPPAREAWIEIAGLSLSAPAQPASPPAREAWIEIIGDCTVIPYRAVASRKGGVD